MAEFRTFETTFAGGPLVIETAKCADFPTAPALFATAKQ